MEKQITVYPNWARVHQKMNEAVGVTDYPSTATGERGPAALVIDRDLCLRRVATLNKHLLQ